MENRFEFEVKDPGLESALEQVRTNHEEAQKFASDPEAYLQSKGVDTEGLKFKAGNELGELSDADLEAAAGGAMAPSACGSVGAGGIVSGCITIGDSPGTLDAS